MVFFSRSALVAAAASLSLVFAALSLAAQADDCAPAGPCSHPLPVRVVIVTMFEIGKDSGDTAGEFQTWKERRHLDTRIPFPQGYHDLFYNPDSGILGIVTGVGSIRSSAAIMALGLDPRFDLRHAYWLVAGIAGIDPQNASIGSAAWARYAVDGDLAHEIDAREIPSDWPDGLFPLDSKGPLDGTSRTPDHGEVFALNPALADWAFRLTRNVVLDDNAAVAAVRARYVGFPAAQRPPFVLEGDNLSAMRFWHGSLMNRWANDWVRRWTGGKGEFVTSAMEESGTMQALDYLTHAGKADRDRVMVLRAGSNYTLPPPGTDAAHSLAQENLGYSGLGVGIENLYRVGSVVIDRLLADWPHTEKEIPR
ncbi:purine nucleoside permease [Novosphingobium nitrogenifigens]|uniref:purine nucleoside permease n=1 Tax=Novosphingobium nitrogenifigens TaxID=378548 RepID=UPI000AB1F126|nr:purine nucleoside permease [Novosphingobium nitrogenifigens]